MPVWWCWKGHLSCFSQWGPFSFPTQAVSLYWALSPALLGWYPVGGWEAGRLGTSA